MKIKNLKIDNGCREENKNRTAASMTGLDPETEVSFVKKIARETGTARKDYIYRVVGTDIAVIIHMANGGITDIWRDDVEVDKTCFRRSREYARRCSIAAKQHKLPMEVVLAVGPEYAADFAQAARLVRHIKGRVWKDGKPYFYHTYMVVADPRKPYPRPVEEMPQRRNEYDPYWELSCGIARRKEALLCLLWGASDALRTKVERLGQENSMRLAKFFMES